jgi:hypothetical protein
MLDLSNTQDFALAKCLVFLDTVAVGCADRFPLQVTHLRAASFPSGPPYSCTAGANTGTNYAQLLHFICRDRRYFCLPMRSVSEQSTSADLDHHVQDAAQSTQTNSNRISLVSVTFWRLRQAATLTHTLLAAECDAMSNITSCGAN